MVKNIFLLIVTLCSLSSIAQVQRCATKMHNTENTSQLRTLAEPQGIITIPIVVHVVYNTSNPIENVSDAQIYSQIAVLNRDYRFKNEDTIDIPSHFRSVAADCEINFCLATKDPSGNPTTGIIRKATTKNNVGSDLTEAVKTESPSWDRSKYLNIWVCEIEQSGNVLGYAYSGSDAVSIPAKDGVVIDYRVFGDIGTGNTYIEFAKGRTTTHEIGHYFELIHIWGDDEDNANKCGLSDNVDDTPNQSINTTGCPSGIYTDACSPNAYGRMYQNYMDYTDDACMIMFTQGQKTRMRQGISLYRSGLLTSNKCTYTHVTDNTLFDILPYPNPTNDLLHISISAPDTYPVLATVMDMWGHTLLIQNINFKDFNASTFNVSDLPAGMYWIQLQQGNRSAQHTFVKL